MNSSQSDSSQSDSKKRKLLAGEIAAIVTTNVEACLNRREPKSVTYRVKSSPIVYQPRYPDEDVLPDETPTVEYMYVMFTVHPDGTVEGDLTVDKHAKLPRIEEVFTNKYGGNETIRSMYDRPPFEVQAFMKGTTCKATLNYDNGLSKSDVGPYTPSWSIVEEKKQDYEQMRHQQALTKLERTQSCVAHFERWEDDDNGEAQLEVKATVLFQKHPRFTICVSDWVIGPHRHGDYQVKQVTLEVDKIELVKGIPVQLPMFT